MAISIKPMSKSQLRQYVEEYRSIFGGWETVRGEGYLRTAGPVAQQVWFENLRSGAYRPVAAVSILVAKNGAMLHRFLDIPNREVFPREHDSKFAKVREAMRDQFLPSITSPLNAIEVRGLCEEQAVERMNDAHSLSALNAYLGDNCRAVEWIDVLKRLAYGRTELAEWENDHLLAARTLEKAIGDGSVQAVLDEVRLSEESRLRHA